MIQSRKSLIGDRYIGGGEGCMKNECVVGALDPRKYLEAHHRSHKKGGFGAQDIRGRAQGTGCVCVDMDRRVLGRVASSASRRRSRKIISGGAMSYGARFVVCFRRRGRWSQGAW